MFLLLQERQVGDKLPPTRKCDNLSRFENAHFLVPACGVFLEKSFRVPKVVPKNGYTFTFVRATM